MHTYTTFVKFIGSEHIYTEYTYTHVYTYTHIHIYAEMKSGGIFAW